MGELRTIIELTTMDEPSYQENIRISWDEGNTEEIEIAEKTFKKFIDEGWIAFEVTSNNERVQIFNFSPDINKIILVPPLGGG